MSKIYEAFEKSLEKSGSVSTDLKDARKVPSVRGVSDKNKDKNDLPETRVKSKFHSPGVESALGRYRNERPRKLSREIVGADAAIASVKPVEVQKVVPETPAIQDSYASDVSFANHTYTVDLDDVRTVSAVFRSTLRGKKPRTVGLIGLSTGVFGADLVRDLAVYEAQLDVAGVILVDADRFRNVQARFYNVSISDCNFTTARAEGQWRKGVFENVSPGVDLMCFSTERHHNESKSGTDAYAELLAFCRAAYELTIFNFPADGVDSEVHAIGELLDCVVVLCSKDMESAVINRYLNDLKQSGVDVYGVIKVR